MAERQPNTTIPDAPPRNRESVFGRKDVWALTVGAVLIVLLYLGLSVSELLRDDQAPASPASPPVPVLRAVLVVGTVEVQPTKVNGAHWDLGTVGHPEPRVTVVNRTQITQRRTSKAEDTLKATFNAKTVSVREGDEVHLRVDDVDVQFDDLIGEHDFRVTREMLEQGELTLSFGQVKSLTLRFER